MRREREGGVMETLTGGEGEMELLSREEAERAGE